MADKWKNDPQDEPISGAADERMRGVADEDDEFDDAEDLDDEEEEEEGSTF
jgi:hypothetical protein